MITHSICVEFFLARRCPGKPMQRAHVLVLLMLFLEGHQGSEECSTQDDVQQDSSDDQHSPPPHVPFHQQFHQDWKHEPSGTRSCYSYPCIAKIIQSKNLKFENTHTKQPTSSKGTFLFEVKGHNNDGRSIHHRQAEASDDAEGEAQNFDRRCE